LALDENKICGLLICRIVKIEEDDGEAFFVPEDFDEYIDRYDSKWHLSKRVLWAICYAMEKYMPRLVTDGCQEYLLLNNLSTHPEYQG
jgi:hypothetical protein